MRLEHFFQEIESHCESSAIATFMSSRGEAFAVDLQRQGGCVIYGYQSGFKKIFAEKLKNGTSPGSSLVLRSVTSEIDEFTQLPIKELRGYGLKRLGNDWKFERLSPEAMFACQNVDAKTGEPLSLEQAMRYC